VPSVTWTKRPTVREVVYLADAYCMMEGNHDGGCLHIALDDGNVDDGHIDFYIKKAIEGADRCGVALGEVLRLMSRTQRQRVYKLANGACTDPAGMCVAPFLFDCCRLLDRAGVDVNRLTNLESTSS
jgi:hypothetical protein